MALNKFGIFIRKFRIEKSMILKDMASDLGYNTAYLSGLETGTRAIPSDLEQKLRSKYEFTQDQIHELQEALDQSQKSVTVNTQGDALNSQLMMAFSRSIKTMDEEKKKQILNIIKGVK